MQNTREFFKKHWRKFIFPVFLIVGIIREQLIDSYLRSIRMPTMKGFFTLYTYALAGFCLALVVTMCYQIRLNFRNRGVTAAVCVVFLLAGVSAAAYVFVRYRLY